MAIFRKSIDFQSLDGDPFSVKVPAPADIESFFVFSYPKAGSTLLDNIMRSLCDLTRIPYVTIANDAFGSGVPLPRVPKQIEKILEHRGYAYLGFRNFFFFDPEFDFSQNKKILLVRDPRDMVVSLYFSLKHSHTIPKRGLGNERLILARQRTQRTGIDDYVAVGAQQYNRQFKRYFQFINDRRVRTYRYEDIIFDKSLWVRDIASYLSFDIPPEKLDRIARQYDVLPDREDPKAHIRQVRPGNYKKHLSAGSIEKLNHLFKEYMAFYGYD